MKIKVLLRGQLRAAVCVIVCVHVRVSGGAHRVCSIVCELAFGVVVCACRLKNGSKACKERRGG